MRALARLLAVLAILALPLLAGTSTATASARVPAIPTGTDCLRPPTPASPTSGVSAWIDPGPAEPKTGDPFDPDSGVSIYDVYGYAGNKAIVFDPGCIDGARIWDAPNELANLAMGLSGVLIATAVRFTRVLLEGSIGSLWDPLQQHALRILGDGLFIPLIGVALVITGVWVMSRQRKGDLAEATKTSVFTAAIVLAGFLSIGYSLTVGAAVDKGIGAAFTAANDVGTTVDAQRREPADAVAANLVAQVMYNTWATETFGSAAAAEEFGPRLFAAGALTREEQAAIDANPGEASRIIDEKQGQYKAVAREVEAKYPQAYVNLAGNATDQRFGHALAGLAAAIASVGYLLYCLARMAWAMVVARVGIGVAPAVALVAQVPQWQHFAMDVVTWVAGAFAKAVAFGFAYVVFLVGGVGGIMSPANEWHPLVKVGALLMLAFALHSLMRRFGMAPPRRERAGRRGLLQLPVPPIVDQPGRHRVRRGGGQYVGFGGPPAAPREQPALSAAPVGAGGASESVQRTRRVRPVGSLPSRVGSASNPIVAGSLRSAGRGTPASTPRPAPVPLGARAAMAQIAPDPRRVTTTAPAASSSLATRRVVRGEVVRTGAEKATQAAQLYRVAKVAKALPAGPAGVAAAAVVTTRKPGGPGGAARLFRPQGGK